MIVVVTNAVSTAVNLKEEVASIILAESPQNTKTGTMKWYAPILSWAAATRVAGEWLMEGVSE